MTTYPQSPAPVSTGPNAQPGRAQARPEPEGGASGSGRPAIGSMCSGYSGLEMAVTAVLGGRVAWVADNDPAAAKVLAHHHPDVPNLGDITRTDWAAVQPVDVLTAGFPCQPVSLAGRRLGEADDRWIWPAVARAVRDLRPGLVYLENVGALVARGLARVTADLAAIGYVGSWRCVRASDVGASHRRERIFIAARPAHADGPTWGLQQPDGGSRSVQGAAVAGRSAEQSGRLRGGDRGGLALVASDAGGFAGLHSHGHATERRRAGDTEQARMGRRVAAHAHGDGLAQRPERHRRPEAGLAAPQRDDAVGRVLDWGPYGPAIDRWAAVLGRPAPAPTEPAPRGGQRLSPAFVEWMMGLPAGHVTAVPGLSRNAQLRLLGNGVVWQQGAYALRSLLAALTEGAVA